MVVARPTPVVATPSRATWVSYHMNRPRLLAPRGFRGIMNGRENVDDAARTVNMYTRQRKIAELFLLRPCRHAMYYLRIHGNVYIYMVKTEVVCQPHDGGLRR